MLICSKCKCESIEQVKLYTLCNSCGIGIMITVQEFREFRLGLRDFYQPEPDELADKWDAAEKMRKQNEAMQQALDSFKINSKDYQGAGLNPPDDFFDPGGYVDEKPMHPNCSCHSTPVVWNLQLSADDIDSQRFTTCTIDAEDAEPEETTTATINKMSEIFVNTFENKELSD